MRLGGEGSPFFVPRLLEVAEFDSGDSTPLEMRGTDSGGKSRITLRDSRSCSGTFDRIRCHDLWTSGTKKRSSSGHRAKEGTRRSSCKLESSEETECCGRFRRPRLFLCVTVVTRSSDGICRVM